MLVQRGLRVHDRLRREVAVLGRARREVRELLRERRHHDRREDHEHDRDADVHDDDRHRAVEPRAIVDAAHERREQVGDRPRRHEDEQHVRDRADRLPHLREHLDREIHREQEPDDAQQLQVVLRKAHSGDGICGIG